MMKHRRRTSCVQELERNEQRGKGEWQCASCQTWTAVEGPSVGKHPRSESGGLRSLGVRPKARRGASGGMGALGFSAYSQAERSWVRGLDAHVIFTDRGGPYPAGLRQDDTITSFHIFPRTEKELEDNFILWDAVNNEGVFERRHPFQVDVCALLLPKKLYSYLRCVQRKDMAATILEILSDIINFDEVQGTQDARSPHSSPAGTELSFPPAINRCHGATGTGPVALAGAVRKDADHPEPQLVRVSAIGVSARRAA